MKNKTLYIILTYCIAAIWLLNGLFCKLLNLVPRHQQIVARILGNEHALFFTKIIGVSEILMAVWILSGIKTRLNAAVQITIIGVMNTIEFFVASDLLLWGKLNSIFALILIIIIYYNEFILNKKISQPV